MRALFYAGGTIATAAGLHTVVAGARSIAGQGLAGPAVESELRFYSAFYVAYGLAMLRAAPRADRDAAVVRGFAGALFLAGLARAGAWRAAGAPTRVQQALLAVELAAPPYVVARARRSRHPVGHAR